MFEIKWFFIVEIFAKFPDVDFLTWHFLLVSGIPLAGSVHCFVNEVCDNVENTWIGAPFSFDETGSEKKWESKWDNRKSSSDAAFFIPSVMAMQFCRIFENLDILSGWKSFRQALPSGCVEFSICVSANHRVGFRSGFLGVSLANGKHQSQDEENYSKV